jgi:hypothetical protein
MRTVERMAERRDLRRAKVGCRVLYHRADIETVREQMRLRGKG